MKLFHDVGGLMLNPSQAPISHKETNAPLKIFCTDIHFQHNILSFYNFPAIYGFGVLRVWQFQNYWQTSRTFPFTNITTYAKQRKSD
jgi:hypothetical protein